MPESIRIGLIGCGAVVRTCHLPALRELPGVTVTAVVDADTGRAAAAAQQVAGFQPADPPLVATSLAAALPRIDAALVCTSHASHASITATLLRAGKHVLVEKPLATTVADCDMLSGLREAGGLVLAVGHVRRLFPMALWISQLLTTGALGQPRSVLWKEGQSFEWPVMSASMFQADTACGGVVLDTGVHVLDLLMMWFGDDVTITGYRDDFAGGIESEADISLQIGAVTADVLLSRQRSLGNYCEITGSAATVRVGIFGFGLDYQIRHHPGEVTTGTVPQQPSAPSTWTGLYTGQLASFTGAIRSAAAPLADDRAGRRTIALARQCYEAAGRGSGVPGWAEYAGPAPDLAGRSVAVTGATGFLGTRLVEALSGATDASVLALTRDYGHLTRLARLPQSRLRFAAADLTAPGGLDAHLAGVDTVIHCAFGNTGSTGERWQATVGGTRAVVQACLAAGVRRLVHVSSIAVHDLTSGEVITEDSRLLARDEDDRDYGQQKLAAEELVKAAAPAGADGLEVVVIRPTIIYGPYGPWWTRRPLEQLAENPAILPSGTAGSCNGACSPVYVDDVVSALLLAAGSADAAGEPFIIGGPAVVHWGEFFDRYRAMLSVPPHADETGSLPDWERGVYRDEAAVAISHAERVLGYKPAFGLGQGMAQAQAWAQWYGLV